MQQTHKAVQQWQAAGGDPAALAPLAEKLPLLLQRGSFAEAEQLLDEIRAFAEESSTNATGTEAKMRDHSPP
jgi:predicted ATPase